MSPAAIISLAFSSLRNRKVSAIMTILAVAVSVMLYLGVNKLRTAAQESFESTISGTGLIVGARTSPVSLVMFSVFHIGDPSASVSWETYEWLDSRPDIAWTVPIALGDSHKGYRVVGTDQGFFEHYRYRKDSTLSFADGVMFDDLFDVVVGSAVAANLNYSIDDKIVLTHGGGEVDFSGGHDNLPFRVSGILKPTGTPVDQSVLISMPAIEAMHVGWETGARSAVVNLMTPDRVRKMDLQPDEISAALVGLTNKSTAPLTRQAINTYPKEPLIAAIPSLAMADIWKLIGVAERVLLAVSGFVILVGLVSILTSIMASLRERRREMAVLRAIGAGPHHIMLLLISEAALLAAIGSLVGIVFTLGGMAVLSPIIEARFGLALPTGWPGATDLYVLLAVTFFAAILGFIPAYQALRNSLADGLSIKL